MNTRAKKLAAFSLSFAVIVLIFSIWFSGTQAAIPKKLTIQGRLDQGGSLADGNYAMVFKIYDVSSGGTALYTESHTGSNKVAVHNGFFKTTLGDLTALNLDFDVPYWLGITIESDSEISPRIELTSSSYAMKAGGLVMDENLNVDSGTLFVDISNNKVGIGTASPSYKLDVSGIVNATQFYQGGSPLVSGYWTQTGSDIYYNTGNVGIGTTTPQNRLHVQGPKETFAEVETTSSSYSSRIHLKTPDSEGFLQAFGDSYSSPPLDGKVSLQSWNDVVALRSVNGGLEFYTGIGNDPRMILDTSGNVGIGTTNPGAKLDVAGSLFLSTSGNDNIGGSGSNGVNDIYFDGGSNSASALYLPNEGSSDSLFIQDLDGTGVIMYWADSGNVGIGTTSPGSKLTVAGTIESTSGGIKFPDGTTQTTAASAGSLSCTTVSAPATSIDCPSGYTVTGCGVTGYHNSTTFRTNGCNCTAYSGTPTCYARCCKVV